MKIYPLIIPAIVYALHPFPSVAQDYETYDIGTYQPPDYTYREFTVVPEIIINNMDSSFKKTNSLASELETSSSSSSRYALIPGHRFHLYTKKLEFGSHNFINAWYESNPLSKTETDNIAMDSRYFYRGHDAAITIESRDSARLYHSSGAFVGALAGLGLDMDSRDLFSGNAVQLKPDASQTISYNRLSSSMELIRPSLSLFIGIGWGRIRDVTFGAVALTMLDRINEIAPKSAGIPANEVQDFASFIEKRRRLRAFDNRLAFIGNIDTLSRYLVSKRAIEGPSSAVTMELADQWLYAFAQNRQAGLEFSLFPGVTVDYSRNISADNTSSWRDTLSYDLLLIDSDLGNARKGQSYKETVYRIHQYQTELNYCIHSMLQLAKPVNRFFQISAQIALDFHWNHYFARSIPSDIGETRYEKLLPVFEADASCMLAFYPDTRTTLSFTPTVLYNRSFNYLINENRNQGVEMIIRSNDRHNDYRGIDLDFPLNIIYYVSPRLQYRVSAVSYFASRYSSEQSVINGWNYNTAIRACLTYQLF